MVVARQSLRAGGAAGLVTVDLASGAVSPARGPETGRRLGGVAWLADGRGVVTTATEKGATNRQVWRVSYPGGEKARLTNDLTDYEGVSLSADSRALVTIQTDVRSSLSVTSAGGAAPDRTLSSGSGRYDGLDGLAWTPDGRIVYASGVSGDMDIWIMDADGSGRRQLTVDPATDAQPAVCGGGRFVFFTSTRSGTPEVWRMGIDGADPTEAVHGAISLLPICAPGADSVVYTSISLEGRFTIWRLPIAGGDPVKLREIQVRSEAISPDGRFVAGAYADPETERQSVAVVRLDTRRSAGGLPDLPDLAGRAGVLAGREGDHLCRPEGRGGQRLEPAARRGCAPAADALHVRARPLVRVVARRHAPRAGARDGGHRRRPAVREVGGSYRSAGLQPCVCRAGLTASALRASTSPP